MAITAMGLGNKAAPEGANLDPQRQFWSWLEPFVNPDDKGADSGHHERGYFSGFACTQTDPAGMSIKIGGGSTADSALLVLTDGRCVLLSTNGEPELVTIPTAPATGSRIDAVVSYIDTTSPTPETETPGTPEYVHTIVVRGTVSSNPSAPTDSQIVGALPAGANSKYYRWCDVKVAAGQTVITNSDITNKKPMSPNLYFDDDSLTDLPYEPPLVHKYADVPGPYGIRMQCSRWGDFCTVTTAGSCSGTMPANGKSAESTPEWCRPWQTQPRCGGAFGGYLGAFWINYSGNLCWVAGGSITKGNSVTINISWMADPNTRPTS